MGQHVLLVALDGMPYAMLFRNLDGVTESEWHRFQRDWVRPQYVGAKMRQIGMETFVNSFASKRQHWKEGKYVH